MSNDSFWSWNNYLRFLAAAAIAYGCSRLHGIERAIRELRVEVRVIDAGGPDRMSKEPENGTEPIQKGNE